MSRARLGLLVAVAAAMLGSGCGTEPSSTPPPPPPTGNNTQAAPTAPVGPSGQPIVTLCDLLSADDFSRLLGVKANAASSNEVTATNASCTYGDKITLTVKVLPTPESAAAAVQDAIKTGPFTTRKDGPMGGVNESVYGTGKDSIGMVVRREKLVFLITGPGTPKDGEVKLIQLAGLLLSRVNALGA